MRNLLTLSITLLLAIGLYAQVPQAFKYQAVVRGNTGNVLVNQLVSFKVSILQGSSSGTSVYSEKQTLSSNDYGIVNMNVGTGTIVSGNFTTIDWGGDDYFIKVEFDATGGANFQFMGSSQILSVPYSIYAKKAGSADNDNDTNPANELQAVSLSNDTLYLSNGGHVYLGDYLDNTDGQTLTLAGGNTLSISGGNSIVLSQGLADADADPTNELQNLSLNNNTLSISQGNSVNLPPDGDSSPTNEIQNLSLNGGNLSISGGNTVALPPDGDSSPTNELQTLSVSNDSIHISQGNSIPIITKPYSFEYPHGFEGELVYFNPNTTTVYTVPSGKVLYITSALGSDIQVNSIHYLDAYRNSFSLLPCFGSNTPVQITTNTGGLFCGLLMDEKPDIVIVKFQLNESNTYIVPTGKILFLRSGILKNDYSLQVNGTIILPNSSATYQTKQLLIFPEGTVLSYSGSTLYGFTGYLK